MAVVVAAAPMAAVAAASTAAAVEASMAAAVAAFTAVAEAFMVAACMPAAVFTVAEVSAVAVECMPPERRVEAAFTPFTLRRAREWAPARVVSKATLPAVSPAAMGAAGFTAGLMLHQASSLATVPLPATAPSPIA